jgi:inhibitor of KinA
MGRVVILPYMLLPNPNITWLSEDALLLRFQTGMQQAENRRIHRLAAWLRPIFSGQISDMIPAYDSLLICFHGQAMKNTGQFKLSKKVETSMIAFMETSEAEIPLIVPVCYDPDLGNDLPAMQVATGLSAEEIIALHCKVNYHVFLLGFLPGFAYMGSVDERIALPRKAKPVSIKPGAVGIAGRQTGIYPTHSPGGWNIVGYTPLPLFDLAANPPTLLQPGQAVRFNAIGIDEFNRLRS